MKILRLIIRSLMAVLCFAIGCLVSLFVLMRLLAPGPDCPSPCDGPVYVAVGLAMLIGPLVGVFLTRIGLLFVPRLFRGKRAHAAWRR